MHKNQLLFVLVLIFAAAVTLFGMSNARPVEVNLLFTKFYASQALVVFISAAMGAVIVTLMGLIRHFKLTGELRSLRKENEKLRNQSKFNEDEKKIKAEAKAEIKAEAKAETNPQELTTNTLEDTKVEKTDD